MQVQRAARRNISITDSELDIYLDTKVGKGHVSDFVQDALRYYIHNHVEVKYVAEKDFEHLREEFEILNKNYYEVKKQIDELVESLFGLGE